MKTYIVYLSLNESNYNIGYENDICHLMKPYQMKKVINGSNGR